MLTAVAGVLALVLLVVLPLFMWPSAQAQDNQDCSVQIGSGGIGIVVCGGEVVEQLPLPTVKITVPAPTVTDIVPGPTKTVTVPGPTKTVTATPAPGPTVFITDTETVTQPGPTTTTTARPEPTMLPETVTRPTAPPVLEPAEPLQPNEGFFDFGIDFGDGDTTLGETSLGIGVSLLLIALILAALYGGYVLGYKDADKENASFLAALRDEVLVRHRKG
jgi:hypothetical protein